MDFNLSEEQTILRDGAERFSREVYTFDLRTKMESSADGFSREMWQRYAEMGWLMLGIPEEQGGLGASFEETAILLEQLGRAMILEPFVPTCILGARILSRCISSSLTEELLSGICEGHLLVALAHTERGVGFGAKTLTTRAIRADDGYILKGAKQIVVGGPAANKIIVSAMIDDQSTFSLFLLDADSPNTHISPYALLDGTRAMDITFNDARVPASALLSSSENAFDILEEAQDRAALASMAQAVGSQMACLDICTEYLKTRVQFGQAIGRFQSLQHMMADMFVHFQASRSALLQALAFIDKDPVSRRKAVSVAKIMIGPAGREISASGIQLHGAYGFTNEYPIGHHYKHQLVLGSLFGNADDHAVRLADIAYQ